MNRRKEEQQLRSSLLTPRKKSSVPHYEVLRKKRIVSYWTSPKELHHKPQARRLQIKKAYQDQYLQRRLSGRRVLQTMRGDLKKALK